MERTLVTQNSCIQCGTCCRKGGPALHYQDLRLIDDRLLKLDVLTTIRAGEPVFSPLSGKIEPSKTEFIKLGGRQGGQWTCQFFNMRQNSCEIYRHRPLECQLLECWNTTPLEEVIYQQCLTRRDIVSPDNGLLELIEMQEEYCSFKKINSLHESYELHQDKEILREIERIITIDFSIRQRAITVNELQREEELFFLGRPIFKSFAYYKLHLQETPFGLIVEPSIV